MPKAPDALEVWDLICDAMGYKGMSALYAHWFEGVQLSPEEEGQLHRVYESYPLGAPSFRVWLNQRLKQVQANAARAAATYRVQGVVE